MSRGEELVAEVDGVGLMRMYDVLGDDEWLFLTRGGLCPWSLVQVVSPRRGDPRQPGNAFTLPCGGADVWAAWFEVCRHERRAEP